MGFSVGFSVAQVTAPFPGTWEYDAQLRFLKKQLPQEYGWDVLAAAFNSIGYIERVQATGLAKRLSGFTPKGFGEESQYEY